MLKSGGEHRQRGFTIVELMVALSILSTILVMATFIMIQIGSLYSKGVNSANLQNTNRNLLSDIAASLQLGGNAPASCTATANTCYAGSNATWQEPSGDNVTVYAYCVNSTRYSYIMNREQGTDSDGRQTPHVLWRDNMNHAGTNATTCPPLNLTANKVLADGNSLDPAGTPSQGFNLLADHMRLTTFSVTETPASSGIYTVQTSVAFGDSDLFSDASAATCKGGTGQQFCATSQLKISVTRRVN